MYRILKVFNLIKSKAYKAFLRRNAAKIRQSFFSKDLRRFYRLFRNREFHQAVEVGTQLMGKGKNPPEFIKAYGQSLFYSGREAEGKQLLFRALHTLENSPFEGIIECSKSAFEPSAIAKTEYTIMGGFENYGFLKHDPTSNDADQKSLITKITRFDSSHTNYERYFYLEICKRHPALLAVSPKLVDYRRIPGTNIELLTTEYIESSQSINQKLDEIIAINKRIESVSYDEAKALFAGIETKVGRYIPFLLHQKTINQEAIYEMNRRAAQCVDGQSLKGLVARVEAIILTKKLYLKVQPDIHYSFCHFDFHCKNLMVQEHTGQHFVIDWNNYGIAMRGWDMNFFFGNFNYPFHEIEKSYIPTIRFDNPLDEKVAKIYFSFLQVYIWMIRLNGKTCSDKLTSYFIPAVEFMETISEDL